MAKHIEVEFVRVLNVAVSFFLFTLIATVSAGQSGAQHLYIDTPVDIDSIPNFDTEGPRGTQLDAETVIRWVFDGIKRIHSGLNAPGLHASLGPELVGQCGVVKGSHYCPTNHTIYIPYKDVRHAYKYGDAALAYIIAHEYAHAMQHVSKLGNNGPRTEKQADCLAGLYLGLISNIEFDLSDTGEISAMAYAFGDSHITHEDHHGTKLERLAAVRVGMEASGGGGFQVCLRNY